VNTKSIFLATTAAVLCSLSVCHLRLTAQDPATKGSTGCPIPAQATRCDLSIPLEVALNPLAEPAAGRDITFAVDIKSGLDPDLVKRMWLEYEYPESMARIRPSLAEREIARTTRGGRRELGLFVPDRGRYRIQARLRVELADGRTISTTATHWINIGNALPEGMVGRIVSPDGTGVRVYQGSTVRN
jgi:hypothetical protein